MKPLLYLLPLFLLTNAHADLILNEQTLNTLHTQNATPRDLFLAQVQALKQADDALVHAIHNRTPEALQAYNNASQQAILTLPVHQSLFDPIPNTPLPLRTINLNWPESSLNIFFMTEFDRIQHLFLQNYIENFSYHTLLSIESNPALIDILLADIELQFSDLPPYRLIYPDQHLHSSLLSLKRNYLTHLYLSIQFYTKLSCQPHSITNPNINPDDPHSFYHY